MGVIIYCGDTMKTHKLMELFDSGAISIKISKYPHSKDGVILKRGESGLWLVIDERKNGAYKRFYPFQSLRDACRVARKKASSRKLRHITTMTA